MDKKVFKEIALASAMYSIGSILGPLLVFGGLGLLADRIFTTAPWGLLISVLIAFIFTNILLFKKIKKINKMMASYRQEELVKKNNINNANIDDKHSSNTDTHLKNSGKNNNSNYLNKQIWN